MEFGQLFKHARHTSGLTQKQVAEKLGIHQSNISDWENDKSRPEYENLIALATIYDTTIDDLLGSRKQ